MFESFENNYKRDFLNGLLFMIMQSKPNDADIEQAIENSKLKSTHTPCIMIKRGVADSNLRKLIVLREDEILKVLRLLLALFKIAYKRRFELEFEAPDKWWY